MIIKILILLTKKTDPSEGKPHHSGGNGNVECKEFSRLVDRPRCFSDPITNPTFTAVARDGCNQTAIAFLDRPGVRILAEGNMARFYGLPEPEEYMMRIARFLSLAQK